MREKENHQSQVSLEVSCDKGEFKKPAATQDLSENDNSQTESQAFENHGEDGLKALARLMMVSLTWSLAGLSKPK
ncbi:MULTISPECIES: hypothetical protein [unclassified Microcoleus]|uniref:hypothetical protein n=1 Tax=unclassified Microcoleus TaxID=2642155 RepID=UPI002FD5053B